MTAIVRIALARPYTFVVMAILILIAGVLSLLRTPTDIFPNIGIPVVATAWQYTNMDPTDMSGRISVPYQRALTTTVNDISHIEATSLTGMGIIKTFFQPGADVRLANAQITAIAQTLLRQMPVGTTPPLILDYDASTVPIVQIALSGKGLTEQQLYDLGFNFIRTRLVTVPGAALPFPYGGKTRQIMLDLNARALQANGLSPQDVTRALAAQTQVQPAGFVKVGDFQYNVQLNNAPGSVSDLNDLPIRIVDGAVVRMRDVAHVRDGSAPQQNVVHVDGQRSVLMTVLKSGNTSTIDIVAGIKRMLPQVAVGLPKQLVIKTLNDQSVFVKAAVSGVIREGLIAAALTSLMILLFLGSWRSTLIVATSIPLSILAAVAALSAMGETLNVMTLGGLALAVGILVDEATVTIENINYHLEMGKDVRNAILDGAQQIVVPAFLSLLCICIVFVPMFYLPGVAGFLFVPLALSVIFAMVASFILSRTLVPTMAMFLLRGHEHDHDQTEKSPSRNPLVRFQRGFERRFAGFRRFYAGLLGSALRHRATFLTVFLIFALASLVLVPFLGRNFFPTVDSGAIALHIRGPVGTRLEETSALFMRIEARIRQIIPARQMDTVVDNIGLPTSSINTTYNASGTIGPEDGDILISLKPDHSPTARYIKTLRAELPRDFPGVTFSYLPADITSQILNFGAPAPIDIQVTGRDLGADQNFARRILAAIRPIDGVADARIQQPANYPEFRVDIDRTRVDTVGLTENDVTDDVATAIAGTTQTQPLYWLDPKNGVTYPIVAQMPEYRLDKLEKLSSIPVSNGQPGAVQVLGALGRVRRDRTAPVLSQYNIQPTIDVYASTTGRDLGSVATDVEAALHRLDQHRPVTVAVAVRGQFQTMRTAFFGMGLGLIGAIVLIYLLIVINFQSWLDPFIIISALPAALAGIAWMLFATGTPLSVPALTGAIMCMGVATANSILVVSFARERLDETGNAARAAFEAGVTRLRPVVMTALAMMIGMAPMAIGLGEGGAQNAPLGRAVIGGLAFATCASLLFVPGLFAVMHGRRAARRHVAHEGFAHA
jgi:multidrug efflux pump subunit AcrB